MRQNKDMAQSATPPHPNTIKEYFIPIWLGLKKQIGFKMTLRQLFAKRHLDVKDKIWKKYFNSSKDFFDLSFLIFSYSIGTKKKYRHTLVILVWKWLL